MGKHYVAVKWTGADGQPYVEIKASWLSREHAETAARNFAKGFAPGTALTVEYLGSNGITRY